MVSRKDMTREIEHDERWLREVMVDPPPPDADRIKLRVRVALGEAWLAENLRESPDTRVIMRTKRGVAAVLSGGSASETGVAAVRRHGSSGARWRPLRWASGFSVAIAASLVLYLGVYLGPDGVSGAAPETPLVNAFLAPCADDFNSSLMAIDDELSSVERSLDRTAATDAGDMLIDDLNDWIDEVVDDSGTAASL